jgi:hypothetical protein
MTIDSNGNLTSTSGFKSGSSSGNSGFTQWNGAASGGAAIGAASAAGSPVLYLMPSTAGTTGQALLDTGVATCPSLPTGSPSVCHQMAWGTSGSSGCMTPVTQTVSGAANITFSSIPNTCRNLTINYTLTGTGSSGGNVVAQFNGDSDSNYDYAIFFSGTGQSTAPPGFTAGQPFASIGLIPWNTAPQGGSGTVIIHDYASTTMRKNFQSESTRKDSETSGYMAFIGGDWKSTSAITSIALTTLPGGGNLTGTVTLSGN